MATVTNAPPHPGGGAFLIEAAPAAAVYSPEDFTAEHLAVARTADEFWARDVEPRLEDIQHQKAGVAVSVLRKSAGLGLTAVIVPERYGGMELDITSLLIVAEKLARDGSYAAWHGAHSGIGTLPLLLYGSEDQKQRYLPRLARAEMVAAYCLSEPQAGSDAMAIRTRADLSADGSHYVLNGQKMWITNGGAADLYTVFAKVGGEHFTAFLVERASAGVAPGAEEKKMGIKGSSTTAVYFDNVQVPAANVLGEVGGGRRIAYNILNFGRLKLAPFAVGGAKHVLAASLRYANQRQAFSRRIGEFGLIRHKLAEMAIRLYAAETMTWRVAGMIEARLADFTWDAPEAPARMLQAIEEYAIECSSMKVYASEMLDYITDEGVQIHGGYGYHQDYAVERAYRDSRINRIFEGTNEINRLLAAGMLLKRARRGQLALVEAVKRVQAEALAAPALAAADGPLAEESRLAANAKKIALLVLGAAYQRFLNELDQQQEVLAAITDIAIHAFAVESAVLRGQKLLARGKGSLAADMCRVFARDSLEAAESRARYALAACAEGDALRTALAMARRFARHEPVNGVAIRQELAARLLEAERYVL